MNLSTRQPWKRNLTVSLGLARMSFSSRKVSLCRHICTTPVSDERCLLIGSSSDVLHCLMWNFKRAFSKSSPATLSQTTLLVSSQPRCCGSGTTQSLTRGPLALWRRRHTCTFTDSLPLRDRRRQQRNQFWLTMKRLSTDCFKRVGQRKLRTKTC